MAKVGAQRKSKKRAARATPAKPVMPLMGTVTWTDPQKKPVSFYLDTDYDPENETGHICLTVKLRSIASIVLSPVRRQLVGSDGRPDPGHVDDAIRLANS